MTKTCTKCNTTKDVGHFNKNKASKDGYRSACKACMSKYRKENADKIKAQKTRWTKNNKDHVANKKRQYYLDNKEYIDNYKKEWNKNNPEKYEAIKQRRLKKLQDSNYYSKWVEENPEKVREIKRNYKHRRRQKEAEGSITTSELLKFTQESIKICSYCGCDCQDNYHIDHVEPLSRGGKHEIDNLAIACPSCNLHKSTKSLVVFMASNNRSKG